MMPIKGNKPWNLNLGLIEEFKFNPKVFLVHEEMKKFGVFWNRQTDLDKTYKFWSLPVI